MVAVEINGDACQDHNSSTPSGDAQERHAPDATRLLAIVEGLGEFPLSGLMSAAL